RASCAAQGAPRRARAAQGARGRSRRVGSRCAGARAAARPWTRGRARSSSCLTPCGGRPARGREVAVVVARATRAGREQRLVELDEAAVLGLGALAVAVADLVEHRARLEQRGGVL